MFSKNQLFFLMKFTLKTLEGEYTEIYYLVHKLQNCEMQLEEEKNSLGQKYLHDITSGESKYIWLWIVPYCVKVNVIMVLIEVLRTC